MRSLLPSLAILFPLLLQASEATVVNQCPGGEGRSIVENSVNVSGCENAPCTLMRKSQVIVSIKFKPDKDISRIRNNVQGIIGGVPIPFLGVDNTDACSSMYKEDGKTKVSCPLKAGETYLYKTQFKILRLYPKISVLVHYALTDPTIKKDIICFRLPSLIK